MTRDHGLRNGPQTGPKITSKEAPQKAAQNAPKNESRTAEKNATRNPIQDESRPTRKTASPNSAKNAAHGEDTDRDDALHLEGTIADEAAVTANTRRPMEGQSGSKKASDDGMPRRQLDEQAKEAGNDGRSRVTRDKPTDKSRTR